MKKIESKIFKKKRQTIKRIFTIIIILLFLGLALLAALGNLDAIRTLWKTP